MSGIDFNFQALIVAPPEYGKTTILRRLVKEHLETHPEGRVFVHDPNRQFMDFCAVYEDVHAWKRALRAADPDKNFPRGASVGGLWSELRDEVIAFGKRHNTAGRVRVPILLASDESSLIDDSANTHAAKPEIQLMSNRRHWGIAPIYNAQSATSLVDKFWSFARLIVIFAQPSEKEVAKAEERVFVEPGALRCLLRAPPFRYVEWRPGKGLV